MKRQGRNGAIRVPTIPIVFQLNILLAAIGAALARMFGSREMALAVAGVLPLTLFRTWLLRNAIDQRIAPPRVIGRSLIRMTLSMSALVIGALLGYDILLGVFVGLVLELVAYVLGGLRMGRHT